MPGRQLDDTVARRRDAALAGHSGDENTARSFLSDEDANVRATALGALNRLGALTQDELIRATHDGDPIMR